MSRSRNNTSHRRMLTRMVREADRERLRRLQAALREARELRRTAKRRARETCKAAKRAVREWLAAERLHVRQEIARLRNGLRSGLESRKAEACNVCRTGLEDAEKEGAAAVGAAQSALQQERSAQQAVRGMRRGKVPGVETRGPGRAEPKTREDSDHQVRASLQTDEEGIVWDAVKARIKATPRATRLEVFQHWLSEHQGDVAKILEKHYAADVARLVKEEKAQRKRMQSYSAAPIEELAERVTAMASGHDVIEARPASMRPKALSSVPPRVPSIPPPARVPSIPPTPSMPPARPSWAPQFGALQLFDACLAAHQAAQDNPSGKRKRGGAAAKPRAAKAAAVMRPSSPEARKPIEAGKAWLIEDSKLGRLEWSGYSGRFSRGDQWGEILEDESGRRYLSEWSSGARWYLPSVREATPAELLRWAYIASERGGPVHDAKAALPKPLLSLKSKQSAGVPGNRNEWHVWWDPDDETGAYYPVGSEPGKLTVSKGIVELIYRDGRGFAGVWNLGAVKDLTFDSLVWRARQALRRPADASYSGPIEIDTPRKKPKAKRAELSLADFAAAAKKAAENPKVKKFHQDRAFIASVWDFMRGKKPIGTMTLERFKQLLIDAHRQSLLRITRADLVGAMDPADVERSEATYMGATFHFIALDHVPF